MVNVNHYYFQTSPTESDIDYETSEESDYSDTDDESEIKSFLQQADELRQIFDLDRNGCYGKWSLFVAAALHYRREDLLKPIPPCYDNGIVDMKWLLQIINKTPQLSTVHYLISEENYNACNPYVIELLHSVLLTMAEPTFHTMKDYKFQNVMDFTGLNMNGLYPTDVFDMCVEDPLEQETTFQSMSTDFYRRFAFFGAPPAHFYSILFNGFPNKDAKTEAEVESVEAKQIHLTTDLSVSLNHSDAEPCCDESSCDAILRCVALCEYIDRPDFVQFRKGPNQEHTDIFICNGKVIRIRQMMFFRETLTPLLSGEPFEFEEEIHDNESTKGKYKKRYLTIGCYMVAGVTIYIMYKRNVLGIKTFMEYKLYKFLQNLAM